jgi:hypothetical protein
MLLLLLAPLVSKKILFLFLINQTILTLTEYIEENINIYDT